MGSVALKLDAVDQVVLSLNLPEDISFEEWEEEGVRLRERKRRVEFAADAINWQIGDWWNAGHKLSNERRSVTAKRLFGLDYGTIRNYGSVAAKFDLSHRYDNLTFTHYIALAPLPAEVIPSLIQKAVDESLAVRALQAEIQAIKASNDTGIGVVAAEDRPAARSAAPELSRQLADRLAASAVHFAELVEATRPLSRHESDEYSFALNYLEDSDESRDRPAPPDTFDRVFIEQGRLACEDWFGASRISVNRWMRQCDRRRFADGECGLREARASYVKYQRAQAKSDAPLHADDPQPQVDLLLPIARQAAQHLRVSRWGGHTVSQHEAGGWLVGSVRKSSEELITMAERVGFDRAAAAAEADREGY